MYDIFLKNHRPSKTVHTDVYVSVYSPKFFTDSV